MEKRINNLSQEEMDRCMADPCYFYNTYIRHKDQPELSQEEFEQNKQEWISHRQQRSNFYTQYYGRMKRSEYPLTFRDCVEKPR